MFASALTAVSVMYVHIRISKSTGLHASGRQGGVFSKLLCSYMEFQGMSVFGCYRVGSNAEIGERRLQCLKKSKRSSLKCSPLQLRHHHRGSHMKIDAKDYGYIISRYGGGRNTQMSCEIKAFINDTLFFLQRLRVAEQKQHKSQTDLSHPDYITFCFFVSNSLLVHYVPDMIQTHCITKPASPSIPLWAHYVASVRHRSTMIVGGCANAVN